MGDFQGVNYRQTFCHSQFVVVLFAFSSRRWIDPVNASHLEMSGSSAEWRTVVQDDELGAGLDVARVVFCETLVEPLVGLDQAQDLKVVLLLQSTQDRERLLFNREGWAHRWDGGRAPELGRRSLLC